MKVWLASLFLCALVVKNSESMSPSSLAGWQCTWSS
uniref:Plasminogen activator, urokinase n=1 Tax=Mus musculus TaxID=10090 RepID=A0A286YE40_MOUSE